MSVVEIMNEIVRQHIQLTRVQYNVKQHDSGSHCLTVKVQNKGHSITFVDQEFDSHKLVLTRLDFFWAEIGSSH